jgi:lysozyme
MQVSQAGIDLIKKHEGLRLRAYLCPAGVWTIGYGTTGPHIKQGMVITKVEAEQFLADDLVKFTDGVIAAVKPVQPSQNELDAMVCFSYNVGLANFRKSSICKSFKAGDKINAAKAFMLWTKARDPKTGKLRELPGLVQRRTEEKQLFMANSDDAVQERPVSASKTVTVPETSVVPEAPKPLSKSREVIGGTVVGLGGFGQLIGGLTADDAEKIKGSTTQLQQDASHSVIFSHMHLPEVAASLTVALSLFIVWKRFSDRNKGIR